MSVADTLALLPLIIVAGTSVAVMLAIAVRRNHGLVIGLTLAGLAVAFASLWLAAGQVPRGVTPLLVVDRYTLFYLGLIFSATFVVVLLCYGYFKKREGNPEEVYVLLLLATVGSGVLVASSHFASFFLGLEILSVSLYASIGYLNTRKICLEAGIKYLALAASSAAFLLFGMALIYAELGTMEFSGIGTALANRTSLHMTLLLPGLALIITGIGFKLGVVPFHLWTPDVYEGAPAPVAMFVATVSKGAMFALLLRYFYRLGVARPGPVFLVFSIIAIASMFAGNLLALLQNNVKRILAYSSIAHLGYLLVAFQAGGAVGAGAATFYLVAYFATTLGAFGVVTVLSGRERDADSLDDYRGLFWRRPIVGGIFTAMLLSLAGIPLTAGFVGKFYIFMAGASSALWSLIILLAVTSAIGLFYYLRIVVAVYSDFPAGDAQVPSLAPAASETAVLALLTILLVWLGVYPALFLHTVRAAVASIL